MEIVFYLLIGLIALFGCGWLLLAIATVIITLVADLIRLLFTGVGYAIVDAYDAVKSRSALRA